MNFDEALFIASGNKEAAIFLMDYDAFCGLMDDIIDDDLVTDERLVEETLGLLGCLCSPGWARDNAPRLFPLIATSANAWLDSNRMAKSTDLRTRLSSDVVKSHYSEMERAVALLCGGFQHMREVSKQRRYDYDQPLKEEA